MFFLFFLFSSHVSLQRVKHLSLSMSTYVFTYVYFIDIAFGRGFFFLFVVVKSILKINSLCLPSRMPDSHRTLVAVHVMRCLGLDCSW